MKKNRDTEQMILSGTEEGEILARLSERVERAIATIQELRRERDALKERLGRAEEQLREMGDANGRLSELEEEQDRFRRERTEIRNRIETMLTSLETLEAAE